ncbi:MAG: Arc family DNA-binding protein [Proteobacteria bacterium]|nr:MAG: Arc family DNA-binding protein [Pseudomonadota bacterium]
MADRKSFLLRIDPALWAEVERWAAGELRSVNGQIEYLLREAVRRRKGGDPAPTPPRADEGEQDVGA